MLPRMSRLARLARGFTVGLFIAASPAAASAQITQGPPTPLAVDLAKVPVGSSAQYSVTVGTMPPMNMKIGLVGRSAGANTIET